MRNNTPPTKQQLRRFYTLFTLLAGMILVMNCSASACEYDPDTTLAWDGAGGQWTCGNCGTTNYKWQMSCSNCGNSQ